MSLAAKVSPRVRRFSSLPYTRVITSRYLGTGKDAVCLRLPYKDFRHFSLSSSREREESSAEKPEHVETADSSRRVSGLRALMSRNEALKQEARVSALTDHRVILGQSSHLPIRARFAPSPTGNLHLGSLRTALFNKLAASASIGGTFILRIEDTDQSRLVEDAQERLIKDLTWAGLTWDEGPDCGGPYGPYKQSERLDTYKHHVKKLIKRGRAYRCFCSPDQLDRHKQELHEAGRPTTYPGTCRSIGSAESERRAKAGEAHVVRLKGDVFGRPKFCDAIYGPFQKKDAEEDFVLLKSDGFPTYHLANVVDDHLMEITHVIRGEEWLISTPKHLALYEAFGWDPPSYAHLGLLVGSDGSKLSKRNHDVSLSAYQEKGIFPMALLTWLANLGSSFKPNAKQPRTVPDIADALTFKFTRGGIKLNMEKLDHFQAKYRGAMLWDPEPALMEQEASLLDRHIIQAMLRDIDSVATGQGPLINLLPPPWQEVASNPVPAITNHKTRTSYLQNILASRRGVFFTTETLLQQHPYLIWRPPESMYRASLSSYVPNDHVLQALDDAVETRSLWTGTTGTSVMDAIWTALEAHRVEKLAVYETLRLVGAGSHNVVSHSSAAMFAVLAQEEWRARLDLVNRIRSTAR